MSKHSEHTPDTTDSGRFSFSTQTELATAFQNAGLELPLSDNIDLMFRPVSVGQHPPRIVPNGWAYHPMEGCDGNEDGSPGELTCRRYKRFAEGGAGLIWFEAVAVQESGKAVPRQLFLHPKNIGAFASLREKIAKDARAAGNDEPVCVMQLTFSGRFSKPGPVAAPRIAYRHPTLDPLRNIQSDDVVMTDGELERLEDDYVTTALLAQKAGFDGVDLKSCHLYLISELFSAFSRNGKYGGDFDGRTRFLRNIFQKVHQAVRPDFLLATRMNVYDGIAHPYGWGMAHDGSLTPEFTEPIRLIGQLRDIRLDLLNLTMGTPYYNPHVNRPYDKGSYVPPESQLVGVHRLLDGARQIHTAHPNLPIVGTGFSWLRHFAPAFAAGCKEKGWMSFVGLGRQNFSYPDFPRDIRETGTMKKEKCCICCGKCAELLRASSSSGCVIRDSEVYAPIYKRS